VEKARSERSSAGRTRQFPPILLFALIFICVTLLHSPLLRLPYIWDEAGYYVPAARDLLLTGSLIPRSTVSNAHPPLVMAWVALGWKLFGFRPLVAHLAMLLIASFTSLGIFRLAQRVASTQVALAATICTGLYSVFFTQSALVHLDMAAAGFTLWGLRDYIEDRRVSTAIWFSVAALAKETAILAPLALLSWELICPLLPAAGKWCLFPRGAKSAWLLVPVIPLSLWFGYHYRQTGYVFGNPEFFRYNVSATLHPLRIVLAAGMRVWQLFGYLNLYFLTVATVLAMFQRPQSDAKGERPRIAVPVQMIFLVMIITYVAAMSVVGGAELARYMLPVLPLVVIVCVSTLWRRVRYWVVVTVLVAVAFLAALFVNPSYGFPFEDNLAYRTYVLLHKTAEQYLAVRYPRARILTAWPASDELTRPYLGYVSRPMRIVRIENFAFEQVASAAELGSDFNVALVFSTKYIPPHSLLGRWPGWERVQTRFFGFHRDLPPPAVAQILGGSLVYAATRNGQWIGIIEIEKTYNAGLKDGRTGLDGHQVAGVRLHDQPHFASRLQVK
jgi:hypothetical protein